MIILDDSVAIHLAHLQMGLFGLDATFGNLPMGGHGLRIFVVSYYENMLKA